MADTWKKITRACQACALFGLFLVSGIFYKWSSLGTLPRLHLEPPFAAHTRSYITVNPPQGSFTQRLKSYNSAISKLRKQVLTERGDRKWTLGNTSGLQVILEHNDNFLDEIAKFDFVKGVRLKWRPDAESTHSNMGEPSNCLLTKYYQWVGAEQLCQWLRRGQTNMKYHLMHNDTCYTDKSVLNQSHPLKPIDVNWKTIDRFYMPKPKGYFPVDFYLHYPQFVFYLHIYQDAIVTDWGNVFTHNINVAPNSCIHVASATVSGSNSPLHMEVFVITQYWGNGFFHRMLEIVPRLAPYKQFLQDNPSVKIAVPRVDTMMKKIMTIFGLQAERLVVAPLRAEIVYIPRGSPCGNPRLQEVQLLSQIYRLYTKDHLKPSPRNKLVLIHRSGSRHLVDHAGLVNVLNSNDYGLQLAHWTDRPVPSFEKGMKMFHEAVMVVAPHGAGEANLIFSQPGTYVIELLCNRPHVNLCFQRTSHILGHRYYGIPSKRGCEGFIDVSVDTIHSAVIYFLRMWKEIGN